LWSDPQGVFFLHWVSLPYIWGEGFFIGQNKEDEVMRRDALNKIDGLVNRGDLKELKRVVECITVDLIEEGFDEVDVIQYLLDEVKADAEGAVKDIMMV
jgi:hypothetical protein